jgi:hypothetical protein
MNFVKSDIEKYFVAEKNASLFFVMAGIVAVFLAAVFLISLKTDFYHGAAIPLLVAGLIQIFAGFAIYRRSDEQRIRNVYARDMNPSRLKTEELPRMQKVVRNLLIYRRLEWGLLALSVVLIAAGWSTRYWSILLGAGIALLIQSAFILLEHHFASARAHEYTRKLESFVQTLTMPST